MSKLLIAVKSSRPDYRKGAHNVIRNTWGQTLRGRADVRFFIGKGEDSRDHVNLRSDETALGAPDDNMSRAWKVRDICQWAVGKTYEHIHFVDIDTKVDADALLGSNFERADYQGIFNRPLDDGTFEITTVDPRGVTHHHHQCYPWASGALGYALSRPAFMTIAESYPNASEWAEDMWVGQVLGRLVSRGNLFAIDVSR